MSSYLVLKSTIQIWKKKVKNKNKYKEVFDEMYVDVFGEYFGHLIQSMAQVYQHKELWFKKKINTSIPKKALKSLH